jgi:hypothetical protein
MRLFDNIKIKINIKPKLKPVALAARAPQVFGV